MNRLRRIAPNRAHRKHSASLRCVRAWAGRALNVLGRASRVSANPDFEKRGFEKPRSEGARFERSGPAKPRFEKPRFEKSASRSPVLIGQDRGVRAVLIAGDGGTASRPSSPRGEGGMARPFTTSSGKPRAGGARPSSKPFKPGGASKPRPGGFSKSKPGDSRQASGRRRGLQGQAWWKKARLRGRGLVSPSRNSALRRWRRRAIVPGTVCRALTAQAVAACDGGRFRPAQAAHRRPTCDASGGPGRRRSCWRSSSGSTSP